MSANTALFTQQFLAHLQLVPTQSQSNAIQLIAKFLASPNKPIFILKGYAGTGKTTLISAWVRTCYQRKTKVVLLAPTGRAAKVMSNYAGKTAFTIHKFIYSPSEKDSGFTEFSLRGNTAVNTLFIVDESSMISTNSTSSSLINRSSVLSDLVQFVLSGLNCKLIFVGDTAQLPPVHQTESKALSKSFFKYEFGLSSMAYTLTDVVRQAQESYIVKNATHLRNQIQESNFEVKFNTGPDFIRLNDAYEIEEAMNDAFAHEKDESILILRANKRANLYNQQIRMRVLWLEDVIAAADYLMVVKNNYFWIENKTEMGFIANGETLEILNFKNIQNMYGYDFADATVQFLDYPNQPPIEVKLLLSTLDYDGPALNKEAQQNLFQAIAEDYPYNDKKQIYQAVLNNEFYNALQVKFAYAVTCHKAQGGQWKNVFVEQSWMPEGPDLDYLRWLYTAITRATSKVYLLGFTDDYFEDHPL